MTESPRIVFPGLLTLRVKLFFIDVRSGDLNVYLKNSGTRIHFSKSGPVRWTKDPSQAVYTFHDMDVTAIQRLAALNNTPLSKRQIEQYDGHIVNMIGEETWGEMYNELHAYLSGEKAGNAVVGLFQDNDEALASFISQEAPIDYFGNDVELEAELASYLSEFEEN